MSYCEKIKNESERPAIYFREELFEKLRADLRATLSGHRLNHVLGVEKEAAALGALFCPEKVPLLRAAALLHDLTKEYTVQEHLQVLADAGIVLTEAEKASPKTWHAMTGALLIPVKYPAIASDELIAAVRWHTTGHAGMTLTEMILYLADYIEETRTFPQCAELRERFWGADPGAMNPEELTRHLRQILVLSLDMTIGDLVGEGSPISVDSVLFRNELLLQK